MAEDEEVPQDADAEVEEEEEEEEEAAPKTAAPDDDDDDDDEDGGGDDGAAAADRYPYLKGAFKFNAEEGRLLWSGTWAMTQALFDAGDVSKFKYAGPKEATAAGSSATIARSSAPLRVTFCS